MQKLALVTAIALWSINGFGQNDGFWLTRSQALADLEILETSTREIHPNIYRYTSKQQFDSAFANVRNGLADSVSLVQFDNLAAMLISMIRCGHTMMITSHADDNKGQLPFDLRILNGRVYVLRNLSNWSVTPGSEILAINGVPIPTLLYAFRRRFVADGYGINFKDRIIETDFRWRFATFVNQPDSFKLLYKPNGIPVEESITIASLPGDAIAQARKLQPPSTERVLDFSIDTESNTAIFKIGSFMSQRIKRETGLRLKKTIKKSFRKLDDQEFTNLVIDIRGNTGGKAYAAPLLFSYLTDKNFKFKRKIVFRHGYKFTYPEYLNRDKFSDWVNSKRDRKINDSTFEWPHHRNTRKDYKSQKKSFHGSVYVIINGMTASGGAELASLMRANKTGIFVGEDSGGDYNGVNGYERTFLLLPNSKVGLLIPGWRSIMAWDDGQNVGHGVIPDHEVIPTIDDILAGRDAEMMYILNLIRNGR